MVRNPPTFSIPAGIDPSTLQSIAANTDGKYFTASSYGELQKVFEKLQTNMITKHGDEEISAIFTVMGALFAATAVTLSFVWHVFP